MEVDRIIAEREGMSHRDEMRRLDHPAPVYWDVAWTATNG